MAPVFSGRCLTLCGVVNSKYVVMIVINNDTVQLFTSYFICCVYLRFSRGRIKCSQSKLGIRKDNLMQVL